MTLYYTDDYDLCMYKIQEFKQQNYKIIDASDFLINDLVVACQQISMFEDETKKVYINCFFQKNDEAQFNELFSSCNDTFILSTTKKPQSFLESKIIKFTKMSKKNIVDEIDKILLKNNISFENDTTKLKFLSIVQKNPLILKNELNKLINFCTNKIIVNNDIDVLISYSNEEKIFELVKCMICDKPNALKILDNLLLNKFTVLEILAIISPQLIHLKLVMLAKKNKINIFSIQKDLNILP
jgi:DNA polymerase III delta subunit